MAKKKDDNKDVDIASISNKMISNLNKKFGKKKVFYNLSDGEDPAQIQRWYSTGVKMLDKICAGNLVSDGGVPGGRFIEIYGPESIGKSHICYQIARETQEAGGIVLYVDTELATSIPNLVALGVDINRGFIYAKVSCIEEVFEAAEEFLKEMSEYGQKIPIAIIWDSIGGIGSRIEEGMAFDDIQRPGLNAKQITFGLRKIMPAINESAATFVAVNQVYDILDAGRYDTKKQETKGGKMIKYMATLRLEIKKVTEVWPENLERKQALAKGYKNPIGIKVRCKTYKNKIAPPGRSVEFEIHFGVGIKEHMQMWDILKDQKEFTIGDKMYQFKSDQWKRIVTYNAKTGEELSEVKCRLKDLEDFLMKENKEIVFQCIDEVMTEKMKQENDHLYADDDIQKESADEEDIMSEID